MSTTTTEPCTTGVINELGGCEPVGTVFDPSVVIVGPAVDPLPAEIVTTTVTEIADPPALPATGAGADFAGFAAILLVAGAIASIIARWGKSSRK